MVKTIARAGPDYFWLDWGELEAILRSDGERIEWLRYLHGMGKHCHDSYSPNYKANGHYGQVKLKSEDPEKLRTILKNLYTEINGLDREISKYRHGLDDRKQYERRQERRELVVADIVNIETKLAQYGF